MGRIAFNPLVMQWSVGSNRIHPRRQWVVCDTTLRFNAKIQFQYMKYYFAYGMTIASEFDLPELVESSDSVVSPDLVIQVSDIQLPKLSRTRIYRKNCRALWGGTPEVAYLSWPGIVDFKIKNGKTLQVKSHTDDPKTLNLFILSEALGFVLWQRGLFLFHASSVEINGKAVIFMGTPGAGKSTTMAAFVRAGHRVLGDDLTAVGFNAEEKPFVVPGFPQVKIWENTVNGLGFDKKNLTAQYEGATKYAYQPAGKYDFEPVPLAHYFVLTRARNRQALERFSPTEAPFEFIKHFPLPSTLLKNDQLTRHFRQSLNIAQHASGWRVRRPADFEALQHQFVPKIVNDLL